MTIVSKWPQVHINQIAEVNPGPSRPLVDDEQVSFVPMASVRELGGGIDASVTRPTREVRRKSYRYFEENDVIMAKITPCFENGKIAVARGLSSGRAFGSTEFHVLRPRSNAVVDSAFLKYFLEGPAFTALATRSMAGAVGQQRVPTRVLGEALMPLPPADEQRLIVKGIEEQLSRLESGVGELRIVARKAERMGEALLTRAALGHLLTPGPYEEPAEATIRAHADQASVSPPRAYFSDHLPSLPDGWTWAPAHAVCESIVSGNTPTAAKMTGQGEIPFIKVYNLTKTGQLDFTVKPTFVDRETHSGRLARSRLRPGDVLINIVGPPLGKVAIVPPSYPEWNTNQAVVAFRPLPSLDRQLLVWLLLARPVIGRLVATSKATAGQFNIALNACRALPLPIPPLEEQRRLVEALNEEFTALRRMQGTVAVQLERASQLRRAILSAAFTGRLVNTLGSAQTGATPWSGIIPTPIGVGQ